VTDAEALALEAWLVAYIPSEKDRLLRKFYDADRAVRGADSEADSEADESGDQFATAEAGWTLDLAGRCVQAHDKFAAWAKRWLELRHAGRIDRMSFDF
jgi:hypothetical protein